MTLTLPKGTADQTVRRLFPEENLYMQDPVLWVEDKLGETLWSKQREICHSVKDNRYTAVPSCHDSGKSYVASRIASWWIDAHPPGEAFVVSTAPSQSQVEAILWREIGKAHRGGDLVGRITAGAVPQWKIGSEIVGYGRKPQDLSSTEEAMASFQGIHSLYVLVVIDEAGGIPKWLWDAVDTLVTNENARVLAIGNPDDPTSHFAEVCKPGSGWNTIKISAWDTPNFTGEEVPDKVRQLLLSEQWVEERKQRWGEDSPLYVAKVCGEFPDISDDTLLSPALLRKAMNTELPGIEKGVMAFDIARYGDDLTVGYRNRGGVIRECLVRSKQDTMETANQIAAIIRRLKKAVPAIVDVVGIGAGVFDRVNELNLPVVPFSAGDAARKKKRFKNRRAEVYWDFKEMIEDGEIDLPSDLEDPDLIAQLGAIRWEQDSRGRIVLEKKEDMRKRGLPSPDRADAAVMSTIPVAVIKRSLDQRVRKDRPKADLTSDLLDKEM